MAKPRRVLSDLISEATAQVPLSVEQITNLQTNEVPQIQTNKDQIPEDKAPNLQTHEERDNQTPQNLQVSNLQTNEAPQIQTDKDQIPEDKAPNLQAHKESKIQAGKVSNLQTNEVPQIQTDKDSNLQTHEERDDQHRQTLQVSNLQSLKLASTTKETQQAPELQTSQLTDSFSTNLRKGQELASEIANLQTHEVPEINSLLQAQQVTNLQTPQLPQSHSAHALPNHLETTPRYLQLERKEARLRTDQIDDLNTLTRQLNRQKRGKPSEERLTDNTLIRVAIDLLLQQKNSLKGTTEDELRDSLGLPPAQN